MKAAYRVYFDDRPLFIISEKVDKVIAGAQVINDASQESIISAIQMMDQKQQACVVIKSPEPLATFELFKKQFHFIQAGGGLVKNGKNEYLFIFRRGKWDLPKGKLDPGETILECALREVKEETGIVTVEAGDHLVNTWHVYHEKGKFILKESVWFYMSTTGYEELTPQTEEDILEIKWLKKEDWSTIYDETFPSIKDVLKAATV